MKRNDIVSYFGRKFVITAEDVKSSYKFFCQSEDGVSMIIDGELLEPVNSSIGRTWPRYDTYLDGTGRAYDRCTGKVV